MTARELALNMLLQITDEQKLSHIVIGAELQKNKDTDKKERAFATLLCEGTLERLITLDYAIRHYLSSKGRLKPVIRGILRISFYQLLYTDVPKNAVCDEAVKLTKKKGYSALAGFVNAVLREAVRNPLDINASVKELKTIQRLSVQYSVPEWLVEKMIDWYGKKSAETMLAGFLERKALTIRVNLSKISVDQCVERLKEETVTVTEGELLPYALRISDIDRFDMLDSFRAGCYQVQDESSMLPVACAGLKDGDYVIDCCAAPGGKANHAADVLRVLGGNGKVSARDISEKKLERIEENAHRNGFDHLEIKLADALEFIPEDEGKADVVLADLPCSGLGIIGKKPDIKYRVKPEELDELQKLQRDILKNVVRYLKPGGVLIYSTCTINPGENEANACFIEQELGLEAESLNAYLPEKLHRTQTENGRLQLLPKAGSYDGFFVSRFRKK